MATQSFEHPSAANSEPTPSSAEEWISWVQDRLAGAEAGYRAAPDWLKGHANGERSTARDYAGRELLELVQNAADAATEHGGHGRVRIEIRSSGLFVANTGMPFRPGGVRSLMTAHTSDKPERQATLIGAKGLGFRALLNWSAEPFITSGALEIGFSRAHAQREVARLASLEPELARMVAASRKSLAPILPFPAAGAALLALEDERREGLVSRAQTLRTDGYDTVVAAPFDGDKARKEAISQLREFQPDFLLFVEALDEIVLQVEDEPETRWSKTEVAANRYALEIVGAGQTTLQEWVCLRRKGLAPDPEEEGGTRPYELAIAVRSDGEAAPSSLHCYFPTSVPLPFPALFHATLELDSNRKSLVEKSELNRSVLDALATFYADFLGDLRARGGVRDPIKLLTRNAEFPAPLKAFEECVYAAARMLPLIPTNGGDHVTAEATELGPLGYGYLPSRFFGTLARCRHDLDRQTLQRLKVSDFDARAMVTSLKEAPLTIEERARAIVGIARSLPKPLHDRALLLDTKGNQLTINNSCFPLPASGIAPSLPRWARAKFLHPELWQVIAGLMGGTLRERFDKLEGFGIHEFNANGVITSLRRQAAELLRRGRADADRVKLELIETLYSLRQTVAKDAASASGRTEVICADGVWREAGAVHLSVSYGDTGAIVSALYTAQPERLLGAPEANGLSADAPALAEFFTWLGVHRWPQTVGQSLPPPLRPKIIAALPAHFEVSEGYHRRTIARSELYWGSTCMAEHNWIAGLHGILEGAPSAAILAWLALDPRFDAVHPIAFPTKFRARSGNATYKLYHGTLPDLVRDAIASLPWLDVASGRAPPRDAMVMPGRLSALFQAPVRPTEALVAQFGLSKPMWLRGLLHADVPQRLADLTETQIYRLLSDLKARDPGPDIVRRLYAQILEVEDFSAQRAGEEATRFWREGEVQVRKGGVIGWAPPASATYLDRDNFPTAAREHLALIDLPPRRSATEIEARFGVAPASKQNFSLTIVRIVEEQGNVTALLEQRLAAALPFIRAYRGANSMETQRLRRLDALRLKVVVDAELEFSLGSTLFPGRLEPGRYLLDGDTLLICVDVSETEDAIFLRATTAMSDGLAELFELQSGDDFEKLLAQPTDNLRMLQLRRLLDNQTSEEVEKLISTLASEIAEPDEPLGVDAAMLAAALALDGTKAADGSAQPATQPVGGDGIAASGVLPPVPPAPPPPPAPPASPPLPPPPPPKPTGVVATKLELGKTASRGGWTVGLRIGGATSGSPGRQDVAAPSDAEEWAALFEASQGRFPLAVSRLQGKDAFGCDCLSFASEADRAAFLHDPTNGSRIVRFIEVKSGTVRLTPNEVKAARRHKTRYFIYQVLFDVGARSAAHLTIVADPLSFPNALARECEVRIDQIASREKLRLNAVA